MFVLQTSPITTDKIVSYNIVEGEYSAYDATKVYLAGERCTSTHKIFQAITGDTITGISAWNSGTTYAAGAKVYVEATHLIYQAAKDTLNEYPPNYLTGDTAKWTQVGFYNKGVDLTDTNFWAEIGATNYWGMFDAYTDTQTAGIAVDGGFAIDVTVDASKCNAVSLFNCVGNYVDLTLTSSTGATLWSERYYLIKRESQSWTEYFYNTNILPKADFYRTFPVYIGAKLRVVVFGTSAAKVGMFCIGYMKKAGTTKFSPTFSIKDYSTKETNSFGVTTLVKGKYSKKAELAAFIRPNEFDWYYRFFAGLRATPTVYICHNGNGFEFETMLVYGTYNELSVVVTGPNILDCNLSIEGLV